MAVSPTEILPMWWLDPAEPSGAWAASAEPPDGGELGEAGLVFRGSADLGVVHSTITGGWAVVTPAERDALLRPTRADLGEAFAAAAYGRGLLTIGGRVARTVDDHAAATASDQSHYGLILILGAGCNITCSYCYLGHDEPRASTRLPLDIASAAIREAMTKPHDVILVDLGEIALGRSLLEPLMTFARKAAGDAGKVLQLTVQTNATTLDRRTADLLARHEVEVGVSMDGPAALHDAARVRRNGLGTHDAVRTGLAHLRAAGVPFHLVATVGRHNVDEPAAVLDAIWAEEPASYLLKPVLAEGEADNRWDAVGIDAAEYAGFVRQVVARVDDAGLDRCDQTMQKFLFRTLGDRRGWRDGCTSRTCSAGDSLHVVDHTGTVHACPRFVSSGKGAGIPISMGRRQSVLPASPLLADGLRKPPLSCGGCAWLASCGGGCTLVGQDGGSSVPLPDPHCSTYTVIHEWISDRLPAMIVGRHRHSPALGGARAAGVSLQ